ncbi:MAG: metallophosphoesterase, partial [Candidatus Dechloromonas phosphoritropha]
MKAIIIHLSDSHIEATDHSVAEKYEQIAATVRPITAQAECIFIAYTGDITQSGNEAEFVIAKNFLHNLKISLGHDLKRPINVVVTPGNHDGMFKNAKSTRKAIIEQIRVDNKKSSDSDFVEACTEPLVHYYAFAEEVAHDGVTSTDPLWRDYRFEVGEKTIRFSSLSASWMSTVPESKGELVFPIDKYTEIQEDTATFNILLLHHPLNWYAQTTYHPLRQMVRTHYQIVMSGHEHSTNANVVTDFKNHSVIMLEAPALYSKEKSAFSVALLDMDAETVAQESFEWKDTHYLPTNGSAYWDSHVQIPKRKSKNGFHLTDDAKERLGSLDASFNHPRKEHVQLSDVFVYPDLIEASTDKEKPETLCSELLLQAVDKYRKVIVYGDEQFGKTTLLKHLLTEFHRLGLAPVMLNAAEATGNSEQFLRVVDQRVEAFYGADAKAKYAQAPFVEKVALVDKVDGIGARGDVLARALKNIESQFGRIILTAGETYEVTIVASAEAAGAMTDYKDFRMLGFGFKLRHDLIRRWYEVGQEFSQAELQEKVFDSEQIINSVLGKGLVPMTAFNTLVLLQTIEVNEKGALANAGMAQYYEYMFRHSLMVAKVRADELDEIESYLTYLAWAMFQKKVKHFSLEELFNFNTWFSEHVHRTDPLKRIELLEASKILLKRNDQYSFAYAYLDYFFVAKYLSIHCDDQPELKDTIKHLCQHLYLKDNANIVLFLTHHNQANWVIQEIAGLLAEILSDVPVLELERDAEILNTWVSDRAKIVVDTSDVVENNREVRKSDDAAAQLPERSPGSEVSSISELDQIAQLNLLFKTSEILGQVLKGRYGSIVRNVKLDLMKRLFDAPLRGVNFFNTLVNSEPEGLLLEVSNRLHKNNPNVPKEKADRIAKRFIFSVLGAVADSFISRQGEIIGSPKLVDTIDQVAQGNGGMSYELVAVASKLSYPNNPPIEQIKA